MYNERILQYEHETMGKEIRDLLYRYQGNIWLDSVGRSFDDREIYRIIVGNRTAEKKILFTGAIHGREYMTAKLLVKQTEHFLQYMCEGGNEDFDVAVHVIPMVNPDGAALCHRGIEGIRKKELKEKIKKRKHPSVSYELAEQIFQKTGIEVRITVPGHTQRGGSPCPYDRVLSTRLGAEAATLIMKKEYGYMVGIINGKVKKVPLGDVAGKLKMVSPDDQLIKEAKCIGISFGV